MKHPLIALTLALIIGLATRAAPTPQSFENLLKLTDTQIVIDEIAGNLDEHLEDDFYQVLANRKTPEGLAYRDAFRKKAQADLKRELSLAGLTDTYLRQSKVGWTQEEVDALVAFGGSPVGKKALEKLAVTVREVERLAQRRKAEYWLQTRESRKTALKELKVIAAKVFPDQTPAPEAGKSGEEQPSAEPSPEVPAVSHP